MPKKKSTKSADAQPAQPELVITEITPEPITPKRSRKKAKQESPAAPVEVQAEATAQAADTFEAAFDASEPEAIVTAAAGEEAAEAASEDAEPLEPQSKTESDEKTQAERPRPPAKLERLQKILAQAGIASRRHAEELITEGRVQVNGKVVTELGSKADAARDHIRVDGKLLQGAERLRYFVLNKPKGFVTTVSDPEGRPTVMEFFSKHSERLYPVGRLDYLSEGLLVVTNDGELANKLTRAASGVEKTYLVKISGQPTEEELRTLREGVSIERGKPGEGRVRTAPASVRLIRPGENPWFEVVLIEGRNRELRKMFEEINHYVEKIRRVGYGPLVLDQEPGKMRELEPEELDQLRRAADGKWKPKRIRTAAMLPKEAGRTVDPDAGKRGARPYRPKPFAPRPDTRSEGQDDRGTFERPRPQSGGFKRPGDGRARSANRGFGSQEAGGERRPPVRRQEERGATGSRPQTRFGARPQGESGGQRPFRGRPAAGGRENQRFERPKYGEQPRRSEGQWRGEDRGSRPARPRNDRPAGRSGEERPFRSAPRTSGEGGGFDREQHGSAGRPATGRPSFGRPPAGRPGRAAEDRAGRGGQGGYRSVPPRTEGFGGRTPREGGGTFSRGNARQGFTSRPAPGGRPPRREEGFSSGRPRPGSDARSPRAESGAVPSGKPRQGFSGGSPSGGRSRYGAEGNRGRSSGGPKRGGSSFGRSKGRPGGGNGGKRGGSRPSGGRKRPS